MIRSKIRYIGIDFDQTLCEMNTAFWIIFKLYREVLQHSDILFSDEQRTEFRQAWVNEMVADLRASKIHCLNPELMNLLTFVHTQEFEVKPKIFVYTNNTNEDIVSYIGDVIQIYLNLSEPPWIASFHPQDSRRLFETPLLAADEPGKSLEGIRSCLAHPDDLTPESLLFLDDLLHTPLMKAIGSNYIRILPPFHCTDNLLVYLQSFVRAFEQLNAKSKEEPFHESVLFRLLVQLQLCESVRIIDQFPAPQNLYCEWDLHEWEDFYRLFRWEYWGGSPEGSYVQSPLSGCYEACRSHFY